MKGKPVYWQISKAQIWRIKIQALGGKGFSLNPNLPIIK